MRLFVGDGEVTLSGPAYRLNWKRRGGHTFVQESPGPIQNKNFGRSGLMVMGPGGGHDFAAELAALGAVSAVAMDDERVAAVINETDGPILVWGRIPVAGGQWEKRLRLALIDGPRVVWPRGLIWDKKIAPETLFSEAEDEGKGIKIVANSGSVIDPPSLAANAMGIAIACKWTGIVAIIDPVSAAVTLAVRLPTQAEASIYAEPANAGALVTFVIEGRHSALLLVAADGQLLAHRRCFWGSPPATCTAAGILYFDPDKKWLYLLDDNLEPTAKKRLEMDGVADAAASADGKSFALASDEDLVVGTISEAGRISFGDPFQHAEFVRNERRSHEVEAAANRYEPHRPGGAAALGFAVSRKPAPWEVPIGEFKLSMPVRSLGASGRGLRVHLSGDALRRASFREVCVAGKHATLVPQADGSLVAELPDLEIPDGMAFPLDPKPKNAAQQAAAAQMLAESEFELMLAGASTEAAADLLALTVGITGSSSPPLKWMRPLKVR